MTQAVAVMSELLRLSKLDRNWNWARTAVIAREWRYLEPVRAFCQLDHIPVQMADEETIPYFWRLRETQDLVKWLRDSELVDTATIELWLNNRGQGPFWSLLREAAGQYGIETRGVELPVKHFVEWLAEWGREVRRRQTALLLLTAHRAKGLEFDHVAVLDGGWNRTVRTEDTDSLRRLFYVAMTRARKTLALARFERHHPLIDHLAEDSSILRRSGFVLPTPPHELARRYLRLSLSEVDLGFAGRHESTHSVHSAIARLNTGDRIKLRQNRNQWELMDSQGNIVGRMAQAFVLPSGCISVEANVAAIVCRKREDSQPEFRHLMRCAEWEVVVPDLVFAPFETKGYLQ